MFQDNTLKYHLENSSVIKNKSLVVMEWNLNDATNISQIGNYRYDPTTPVLPAGFNSYDQADVANLYTGATDADTVITAYVDNQDNPQSFTVPKVKNRLYYSLEDCFGKFRPRSGINKFMYFPGKKIPETSPYMAQRPRYYFASKDDNFKYWTSYRTENGQDRGISSSQISVNNGYVITDTAPFVVYKTQVPTNKIVIKMQTNVGTVATQPLGDPFYGDANKTIPKNWRIQKLVNNNWVDLSSGGIQGVTDNVTIGADGYIEFSYGLSVDPAYADIFVYAGRFSSIHALPTESYNGYAYFVESTNSFVIWLDEFKSYVPLTTSYGWSQSNEALSNSTKFMTELLKSQNVVNPQYDLVEGLRIVVNEMATPNSTFDLIELSPRLFIDISDRVLDYSIVKQASDLSGAGLPVGKMLAATGSLNLFDFDQAFSENNSGSILYGLSKNNIQIKFYEAILDVKDTLGNLHNYYVPIKTMYIDNFPEIGSVDRKVSITLRDLNIFFETTIAPQMLLTNQSLSYILTMLFDSIGFSNYQFKRVAGEHDDVIPYFFIGPDTSVAQVLEQLATSTQTAMFFDEDNVFTMLSKNYIMPTEEERATDITVSANQNIINIASKDNAVYNSGKITYISRYIQKTYGTIEQANYGLQDKTWIYKPVLLWEVSPPEDMRPTNAEVSNTSSYSLSAIPLNSDLTTALPTISNGKIINNTMDLGEGVLWLSRYSGYFYANGEVLKYDAVEHMVSGVSGPVWISSSQEYADYFAKLSFNGKIYPTGRIRIFSEPYFNSNGSYKEGAVAKHGRGQFGTPIAYHPAGISSSWASNLHGCKMQSSTLFNNVVKTGVSGVAGLESNSPTKNTTISSIIKNFLSTANISEATTNTLKSTQVGTIQSSALVMNGPAFDTNQTPTDYLSYAVKSFGTTNKFVHYGTRMRIVGTIGNTGNYVQQGAGSSTFYSAQSGKVIGGSGGGLGILVNPDTNNGYFFELAALTDYNVNNYSGSNPINNMFFYKIVRDSSASSNSDSAQPITLWSGLAPILVDDGKFTGQSRTMGEQNPTVYDIAVEYEDKGGTRTFYLYVNNRVVAVVNDNNPLPHVNDNNMALFVRGSSRVMFENAYAISTNYAHDASSLTSAPVASAVFGTSEISNADAFRKYALSGMISSTYLSGIGSSQTPDYNLFYDEFGTIMREVAYMNIRYDKAYPALTAKISPTFNDLKGYTVSGFVGNPYGAEFLIFNNTDSVLTLDEASGNYLRIQGVTFTQQSQNELTVDDYFSRTGDFSSYKFDPQSTLQNNQAYTDIKASRMTYGKKEFTLDAPFIQSQDAATNMMSWIIKKVMKKRKSVGLEIFGMPIVQLGDIVKIDYQLNGVDEISNSRFVVYNIQQSKQPSGLTTTIYLSEVS